MPTKSQRCPSPRSADPRGPSGHCGGRHRKQALHQDRRQWRYERRHELSEVFHAIGKHRLAEWVGTLLDQEDLVMDMVDGSKLVKWLDVPGGPMASGEAAFVTGHLKRSLSDREDQG